MGRRPRILIEGCIYHLYNRVSRGEHVFLDGSEVKRLVDRLAETKRRDGFQIFAWCVMSNHYHLAVRMGEVSLSRSMHSLDQRFAQSYNGRHHILGPFWQGRYRSKQVRDARHLQQLIVYIHLNPVAAGRVNDPAAYRWSGHREVLGQVGVDDLVDVDETLAAFEPSRGAAIARYRDSTAADSAQEWAARGPGQLPWWQPERGSAIGNDGLQLDVDRPLFGMDRRSTGVSRPPAGLMEVLRCGVDCLGVSLDDLRSGRRTPMLVTVRTVLAWVAVELYGLRVADVAAGLGKNVGTASRLVSRAARLRAGDRRFANLVRAVDAAVIEGCRRS